MRTRFTIQLILPVLAGSLLLAGTSSFGGNGSNKDTQEEPSVLKRTNDPPDNGNTRVLYSIQKLKPLKRINFNGYYRFSGMHRMMTDPYPFSPAGIENPGPTRVLSTWDGYWEPNLMFAITGSPNSKTTWGTDLFMRTPMMDGEPVDNSLLLYMGANLYGNFNTEIGDFYVSVGGMNWKSLSTLTIGNRPLFQRFSVFERTPWETVPGMVDKYGDFYQSGTVGVGGNRWANQAFNGLWIDGANLPWDLSGTFFYGKPQNLITQENAGLFTPSEALGGKVTRKIEAGTVSINTLNVFSRKDSVNGDPVGYNILTGAYDLMVNGLNLSGEVGIGQYYHPSDSIATGWGPGLDLILKAPDGRLPIPIELELFYLSPSFINANGGFANTAVADIIPQTDELGQVAQPFSSPLMPLGLMANNRQGVSLNTGFNWKNLKGSLGIGLSKEIERLPGGSVLSYSHRVNSHTVSRFIPQASEIGPYGSMNTVILGFFQTMNINETVTDADGTERILIDETGTPTFDKHFNTVEMRLKYNYQVAGKNLYVFYLNSFNSIQRKFSPIPIFNKAEGDFSANEAFLTFHSHEFDFYYELTPNLTLAAYYGIERAIANRETDIDEGVLDETTSDVIVEPTDLPRNQFGQGVGLGADITLSEKVALILRHRWFSFEDRSFQADKFKGTESRVEMKIFF